MTQGAYRARQARERKTARGECHGPGCTRKAAGYFCEPCKRKLSGQAARYALRRRVTLKFLSDWDRLAKYACIECGNPSLKPICKRCNPQKCAYATIKYVRPLGWTHASNRPAVASLRPVPEPIPKTDSLWSMAE